MGHASDDGTLSHRGGTSDDGGDEGSAGRVQIQQEIDVARVRSSALGVLARPLPAD
jgi:hypothetical protein